jgi:sugar-phosphatase
LHPITLTASAVLLDMDGTLVDSTAVVERVWLDWARPHGLPPERVLEVVHGRQGHESMAILLPSRSEEENRSDGRALLVAEQGDVEGITEISGAARLLRALDGLPHALVTSADDRLARVRMSAAGLAMPAIAVTAEQVSASKPHPEGFLLGAERLGVDPARCVVFEDSEAGIEAGLAAGMTVIGVGERAAAHGPTHAVADLSSASIAAHAEGVLLGISG